MSSTLVVNGTGAMGSAVVRRLVAEPDGRVVVVTRDPDAPRSTRLVDLDPERVRLIAGSLDDEKTRTMAMGSVDRVFCNTNFAATLSPTREAASGLALLEAAERTGVERFVWSSLDDAQGLTDGAVVVPHYDAKAAVASQIRLRRSEEFMRRAPGWYSSAVAVLTTAPYFENLSAALAPAPATLEDGRDGLRFTLPLGSGRYPLIALDDIAWFAVHLLAGRPADSFDLAVVGDAVTGAEIASQFEEVTGIPAEYVDLPLAAVEASDTTTGHDMAAMCRLFQVRDIATRDRDLLALRELNPELSTFRQWLQRTGWRGQRERA